MYESLALRLARHPSESDEHLIARLLAYLMSVAEGELYVSIATENLTGSVVRLKRDTDQ